MWVPVTRTAERIGVLGGTFDPLHVAHLVIAAEVRSALSLDKVLLVPTWRQPFKAEVDAADARHRLEMCKLAADEPWLDVSDVDVRRGRTTYTVDTLTELKQTHPDADLFFVAGADAMERFAEWKDAHLLKSLATFVAVARPGYDAAALGSADVVVEAPQMGVSSTDVRRRVATGAPLRFLVPDAVIEYIAKNGLYTGGNDV